MFSKDLLDASEQKLLILDTDVVVHYYRFSKLNRSKTKIQNGNISEKGITEKGAKTVRKFNQF